MVLDTQTVVAYSPPSVKCSMGRDKLRNRRKFKKSLVSFIFQGRFLNSKEYLGIFLLSYASRNGVCEIDVFDIHRVGPSYHDESGIQRYEESWRHNLQHICSRSAASHGGTYYRICDACVLKMCISTFECIMMGPSYVGSFGCGPMYDCGAAAA
jgi:hypothetical protein